MAAFVLHNLVRYLHEEKVVPERGENVLLQSRGQALENGLSQFRELMALRLEVEDDVRPRGFVR